IFIYINGVEEGSADVSGIPVNGSGTSFRIGSRSDLDYYSNSQIDEVRIWNVARTPSQILSTANTGVLYNTAGLIAYYKFDEASGSVTANSVTGLNSATLVNGAGRLKPTTAPFTSNIYQWNNGAQGNNLIVDTSGSYSVTVTTAFGISATSNTVNVTEHPFSGSTVYETACDSFVWHDSTYYASGSYIYITPSASGCDSVVTLELTINPSPSVSIAPFGSMDLPFCGSGNTSWIGVSNDNLVFYTWSSSPSVPLDVTNYSNGTNERCDAAITETTTFTIVGTSNYGCHSTASVTAVVIPSSPVNITGGSVICDTDSAVLDVDLSQLMNARFATSVIDKSSEYGTPGNGWSSVNALDAPDVYPQYGDIGGSWASLNSDDEREYIELGYDSAAPVNYIDIYETFNPGAVDTVYVKNPNTNQFEIIYTAQPVIEPPSSRILHITFPTTLYPVSEIRIALNSGAVPDWNEIDAVGIGLSGVVFNYEWSNGETTEQVQVPEGQYTVKVSGESLCYQGSTTVSNDGLVSIMAEGSTSICPGDSVVLTAQSNVYNGNALQFDGSGKYIEEDIASLPQSDAARTMECWIKTDQSNAGVIANWGNIATNERFGLLVIGGSLYFVGENNDFQGSITVNDNQWHHVAVAYDGTDLLLYVDGVLDVSIATSLNTTGTTLRIGQRAVPETGEYFIGTVDELRIWNTARSITELNADMNHAVPVNSNGLVSYFKMDEGSSSVTKDEVSSVDAPVQDGSAEWVSGAVNTGNYLWSPGGEISPSITVYGAGTYTVILSGPGGCSISSEPVSTEINTNCNSSVTLNLKVLLAGYYNDENFSGYPGLLSAKLALSDYTLSTPGNLCDTIKVELRDPNAVLNVVATSYTVIDTSGNGIVNLPVTVNGGTYWLAVFHNNSLQTWSAAPITFNSVTTYDFTTSDAMAYDDGFDANPPMMMLPNGNWGLWSGDFAGFDLTQDEFIDIFDQIILDNTIIEFANGTLSGYLVADLNGDGVVDIFDQIILDNNINLVLYSPHPVAP
ncbi:MAG: LamG-like jellyroll fold domain-containing protein, partial [Bacteroidota bacterium]